MIINVIGNNIDYNLSTEAILEVNIPANQTSFTLNVGINDDDAVENNERFNLEIGAKLNYYVERGSPYNIIITIVDNDGELMWYANLLIKSLNKRHNLTLLGIRV